MTVRTPSGRVRHGLGADEREGEEDEADQGGEHRELLTPREPAWMAVHAQDGEHGDAGGADRLHETQRR